MRKVLIIIIFFLLQLSIYAGSLKRVGVILYSKYFYSAYKGLKDGLNRLGYIDRKNIIFYLKNINGNLKLIEPILKDFKKKKVDVILTTTTPVTLKVKKIINNYNIPVIFNEVGAPLKSGIVSSFKKPGGLLTGISYMAFSLIPKRIEVFKDAFPYLNSIIFFYNPDKAHLYMRGVNILNNLKEISKRLGIKLYPLSSKSRKIMLNEINKFKTEKGMGLFLFPDADAVSNLDLIIKFSRDNQMPLMVLDNQMLLKGGCISYSPSFYKIGKQSAYIAQQIFNGVAPKNIPVEIPNDIELAVNYKEIIDLGIEFYFNKNYLFYADEVIK